MPPAKRAFPLDLSTVIAALGVVAASMLAAPGLAGGLGAALGLLMLAIAVIDARWFLIPDGLNAAALLFGLGYAAVIGEGDGHVIAAAGLRAAVTGLAFWAIRIAYRRLRGREGLGLGDVKLAAVAGAWLDWLTLPVAIEIAALSALAVYGVRHCVLRRPLRAATRLPFGLFLAPAIWFGWLLEMTLLRAL